MPARVDEVRRSENRGAADSVLLKYDAVSLGEASSTFGRMAVPSSW